MASTIGCAQPPTAQIDAARARVKAVEADGTTYAPAAYRAAQDEAARLDAEMKIQSEKYAVFRSYDHARELAAAVDTAADHVEQTAASERERLRTQTSQAVADARHVLADATQSLATARLPQTQALSLKGDLTAAEVSLGKADSLLAAGQFTEAHHQAESASQAITEANAAIQEAEAAAQQAQAARRARGDVVIPRAVLADGKRLPAGTYRVRPTNEQPPAVVGESANSERWVEFVRNGKVVGRELAIVLSPAQVREVAKGPGPGRDSARVDLLKGGQYVRVWVNQGGTNFLVHLPLAG